MPNPNNHVLNRGRGLVGIVGIILAGGEGFNNLLLAGYRVTEDNFFRRATF